MNVRSLSLAMLSIIWPLGLKLWTGYESLSDDGADCKPNKSAGPGIMIEIVMGLCQIAESDFDSLEVKVTED